MASRRGSRARDLRAFWATLAVIALLGAGAAYGATRYAQSELEREATHDAHKLAIDVLQPLLLPTDTQGPIRGARYEQLLASVDEGVLAGPINHVRLWRADGTVLFSEDPQLVGTRDPAMRADVHDAVAGASQGEVVGDRFRTLTSLRVGDPPTVVAVELDQSHASLVDAARERWYPWMYRGLAVAAACAVLWVATAIVGGLAALVRRRVERRRASAPVEGSIDARRTLPAASRADLPGYMQPGFQQEVEARRRIEEELEVTRQERDALRERVARLEVELRRDGGREREPDRSARVLPFREDLAPTGAGDVSSGP